MASLSPQQRRVLAAFLAEADRLGASPKERKALVEAGLVEANLGNPAHGDRDSIGSLQERSHYGSTARRLNPTLAARRFLTEAKGANRQGQSAGTLAQAVQRSAFPERYDQRGGEAAALLGGQGPAQAARATTARTTPGVAGVAGVDRSAQRGQLISQFLADKNADPVDLALGVRALKDTPATPKRTVAAPAGSPAGSTSGGSSKGRGSLLELFYDPLGGWKHGQSIGAIGGHEDHVHVAADTRRQKWLQGKAKQFGLTITSTTGGKHAPKSYHYEDKAFDAAGTPEAMAAFTNEVRRKYGLK